MSVTTRIEEVRNEITALASATPTAKDLMQGMCKLLHERMLKYNWVGFYMLEAGRPAADAGAGRFRGRHDSAHANSAEPGHLRGRSFQRENHCG